MRPWPHCANNMSETRLGFFDIDGTLSVPIYNNNGQMVTGFTDEGWLAHCAREREHAYDDCKPVMPVKRYAEGLKAAGAKLFVLSVSQSEGESLAKEHFIETHFPGLFQEVIIVDNNPAKIEVIHKYAENEGVTLSQCELVEDTYSNVLMANNNGIKATHIAALVCDL